MSTEYTLALIGLVPCILALAALVWALMRRQIRAEDQEMYAALADDEPDYSATSVRSRSGLWFVAVFLGISLLIGWLVVQTIITARIDARSDSLAASHP
jgi:ABC-type enterobactin transport system permease subunit